MSTQSDSEPLAELSELVKPNRRFTMSDIINLLIPLLLHIPEIIYTNVNTSQITQMLLRRLDKFKVDLEHIKDHLERVKVLERHVDKDIKALVEQEMHTPNAVYTLFTDDSKYFQLEEILARLNPPGLIPIFESSVAFRQITQSYELLDPSYKECLLCFSAFPKGAEINKRTVIYWWIGEELIDLRTDNDGEQNGHKILNTLVEHGFLEDVMTKGRVTSRCRLRPFIHSVLIYLAQAARFFDNPDGEYDDDNLSCENKRRVCLVKATNPTSSSSLMHLRRSQTTDLECIETLFNVNKCYLDIKLHWFWKMKNMKALYLGKCDSEAIQPIEVKSCKFLGGLKYMKQLRLLSLQGVSKIFKLPDSLGSANNLIILDLRDCNDMEELPDVVKSLEKLTHLDLSGCYSLTRLPKGISYLSELKVLKGFLCREKHPHKRTSCSLKDLTRLKKLRKLSINTSLMSFPEQEHIDALRDMKGLRKLTIAWQGLYREEIDKSYDLGHENFLNGLEKLDLRHIPYNSAPAWLASEKLRNLKKLYIKGGKFLKNLGDVQIQRWEVETLRLLHLPRLSMTWTDLQRCFYKLRYLEQVDCHRLTDIPCDNVGVWLKSK